ncbi:hypothetical protein [uncultured Ferrimonas sp.]|uniref:hypothetical protein n=1 Tax=uncultured Ferrimonas sp. TaxID=432640 RepID=UPI002626AA11|nr:hypothetical protein [uncultured Ferrimonas sp.]
MINPIGLGGLPANPLAKSGTAPKTELTTTATKVAETLVQPADAQDWHSWQQQRANLVQDKPNSIGINAYQTIANQPLREQLQQLVGVDLFV